jgi:molecular chaperone GrpE
MTTSSTPRSSTTSSRRRSHVADVQPDPGEEVVEAELLDDPPPAEDALSEDPPVEVSIEALLNALETVTSERDEFRDAYQRAAADFDNYRKQAQRRVDDEVARASGSIVERLLAVLDACDGALAHGATEVEPIATALLVALEKEGLVRVDPLGEVFDPTVAEAVVHEPGDGGEHIVSDVMRPGYTWQGRVLRPAMVKVTD